MLEVSSHTSLPLISEININNCDNTDHYFCIAIQETIKVIFIFKQAFLIYCASGTISTLLDIIVPGNTSLVAVELEGCFLADGSVS